MRQPTEPKTYRFILLKSFLWDGRPVPPSELKYVV
jgi:hypothetical protein